MTRELLQQALDALREYDEDTRWAKIPDTRIAGQAAIVALEAAIAQPVQSQLTDERLDDLMPTNTSMSRADALRWMGRAVERAHGIQGAQPVQPAPTMTCQTCEALARTVMMDQTYHDGIQGPK